MDHIGVKEVFRFSCNGYAGNGQILLMLHKVIKMGAAFLLMLVEYLLDFPCSGDWSCS